MGIDPTGTEKIVTKPQTRANDAADKNERKQFNEALNEAQDAPVDDPGIQLESTNTWTYTDKNGQIYNYVSVSGEEKVPTGRQIDVVVGHESKVVGVKIYPGLIPIPVFKDEPVVVRRPEIETRPWKFEGWVKDRGEVIEVHGSAPKNEKSTFEKVTDFVGSAGKFALDWGAGGKYVQLAYRGYQAYQDYKSGGVGEAAKNLVKDVLIDKTVGGIVNSPHGGTSTHSSHGGTPSHSSNGGTPPSHSHQGGTRTHSSNGGTPPSHPQHGGTPTHSSNGGTPPSHPSHGAPNNRSVWVQLEDGRIREFNPSEVGGDAARGTDVTTPDGRGKIVGHGDPPNGADVKQPNVQPGGAPAATPILITAKELNDFVPQAKGITGPKRRLDSNERKIANEIQDALMDANRGNTDAMNRLNPYRPHEHTTGQFRGWTSVDLLPGNPGASNVMRMFYRQDKDGMYEVMVRQIHGK